MRSLASISLYALPGIPLVKPGDDLVELIGDRLRDVDLIPHDGDIIVIAQKIVSKSEGRYIDLRDIKPSQFARDLASQLGKDPRHVEVVLSESNEIVRTGQHILIVAHKLGFVMANAGVDESNIDHNEGPRVLLLPRDPDASAATFKRGFDATFNASCGVIINDSFGRPWRNGVVGVALGAAGVPSLINRVGVDDLFGRKLKVTEIAAADELAAAASLLMGQADEGRPVVVIRGYQENSPNKNAASLIRSRDKDMFR